METGNNAGGAVVIALPSCDSTNTYAKAHAARLAPFGAVYTTSQTAGRGRLGRAWVNAAGQALYYSVLLGGPLVQPETLPQLASLVTARALARRYGAVPQIKWPNDLLLGGKKITGILCESTETSAGRVWIAGIGINLAQSQDYFDAAGLPHGTSLALAGLAVDLEKDPAALAAAMTAEFAAARADFAARGFAPLRADYKAACVNLGRRVGFAGPNGPESGIAADVDEDGRLVVRTDGGQAQVFTGEVSVSGIYGAV